ncbi:MAG: hypothetical protein H2050_07200 [Sphingobium sp.]|uniref:hypothetical protein n=1 Tax=Sphingobium sp. TaxID=1912891 RepID=UPI001807864D|nr:hypothetical protein [Sphingobium sp.]MBA4754600.1 hypothetical protein [Sphingobium sp.]
MTMLEEIARAMAKRNWPGATESDINEMWEGWIEEARVALDALKTPTPGMIEAGQAACEWVKGDEAADIYRAMIDAAGEQPQ